MRVFYRTCYVNFNGLKLYFNLVISLISEKNRFRTFNLLTF